MFKRIRKLTKPVWRSAALAFLWSNRRDVGRWVSFAKRSARPASRPAREDLVLEARVRAALSADPVLRSDPSIRDIRVHNGVVVIESPAQWHNRAVAVTRIMQVKGVESVHTANDADDMDWANIDLIETANHPEPVMHLAS